MRPQTGLPEEIELALEEAERAVEVAPHKEPATPREWIRENLVSSWFNGALTVLAFAVIVFGGYRLVRWVFVTADWDVLRANLRSYMIGRFPLDEGWRISASVYLVTFLAGASWGVAGGRPEWTPRRAVRRAVLAGLVVYVLVALLEGVTISMRMAVAVGLFAAGVVIGRAAGRRLRLPLGVAWALAFPAILLILRSFGGVPPQRWSGFALNLVLAVVGMFLSFPIGILLALGRRSTLPVISTFPVGFIELIRGVPLVTLLFFGDIILPLLLPQGVDLARIVRSMAIFTILSSVYVAEVVRGGLQGVHHGQYEAARALGLSTTKMMGLIVLPQALRDPIPP